MALFKSYDKYMLVEHSLRPALVCGIPMGYRFELRYPSYRGTFLSCIEKLAFFLDGQEIPQNAITLSLNGKEYSISQLNDCYQIYWETLQTITVTVSQSYAAGIHTLRVHMEHRIPYTGYGGKCLVMTSECEKHMMPV